MENETIAFPLGKQVLLRGHFDAPVTLEHARALSNGYECRVRLSDGSLQEAVISREEALVLAASLKPGKATNRPVDAEKLRLLIESARVRLAYTHDRQITTSGPFGQVIGGKDGVDLRPGEITNKTLVSSL
jgi:hypothetical protein